jgi:hypothetical protein
VYVPCLLPSKDLPKILYELMYSLKSCTCYDGAPYLMVVE